MGIFQTFFPAISLCSANDQVIIPNGIWRSLCKHLSQITLDFILMGDQKIAFGTVTASVIENEWVMWVNVDNQWHFLLAGFVFALRETTKVRIRIWIQKKVVERG